MFSILIICFLLLWSYCFGILLRQKYTCVCPDDLSDKTVLITGGSDGLGKETAFAVAAKGARVIITCRDVVKGENTKNSIIQRTGNPNILLKLLDYGDLQSVVEFCKDVTSTEKYIHVLVNNAGIGNGVGLTKDNHPLLFATNVLGTFLLTKLLLPVLRRSRARVVYVSSIGHYWGKIDFIRWLYEDGPSVKDQFESYTSSKLAITLLSRELHELERGNGIRTYALHPGTAFTGIFRTFPLLLKFITFPLFAIFLKTAKEAAQMQIHCSLSDDLQNDSGKYYADGRSVTPSNYCEDAKLRRELWEFCAKHVQRFTLPTERKKIIEKPSFQLTNNFIFSSFVDSERFR